MEPNEKQFKDSGERNALRGANGSLVRSAKNTDSSELVNSFTSKLKENDREYGTREAVRHNDSVALLEELAKEGYPTEVSGDALARVKAGKQAKYHREV